MKQQLGHYQIVAELGRGGMGVVYKGYETSLNRYVAIKVLADALANDESVKERFLREARSMAALNDPHIIQIYFIGDDEGQTYFVMEFVDGESLGSLLKREGKLTPEQAAKIVYQTAQGLRTAHDKGVIHRDIKPGNLMITSRGSVKVADFGIALSTQDFSRKLTSTGEFVGTPGYLSPEVCQGNPVDQRSDIFSLGIVLFECLTGRMPFTDESPLGLMLEVVRAEIPDVCSLNSEVDQELSRILAKMVAKDPADRYKNCEELYEDLAQHPLVAKGGPITLQTKLSPAAATLLGQQTPLSGPRQPRSTTPVPQAALTPTPVTNPGPVALAQPQSMPHGAAAADVNQPGGARHSTALPWAIVAIALLAVAGGAYAFRDRIPMLQPFFGSSNTVKVADDSAQSQSLAQTDTASGSTADVGASAKQPDDAGAKQATSTAASDAATQTDDAGTMKTASNVASDSPATTPTGQQASGTATVPSPTAHASDATAAPAKAGQQLAKVERPAPVSKPEKPHVPTIAILAGGDAAVSGPAQEAIASALSSHGFRVVDQDMLPGVGRLMRGERPRYAEALKVLSRGKVDAVVFVHARAVGSQNLTYYGQNSTLYTAQLGVRAYDVNARRRLGRGWSEQVNFTSLNANQKAHAAVTPMLHQVEEQLAKYRPRRRHE